MEPTYTILYVADVPRSVAFYRDLFGVEPVQDLPTFGMFVQSPGRAWGLWQREAVKPAVDAPAGGAEYCLPVESREEIDTLAASWRERGIPIVQEPTEMDFGYTFVALDPDGHRLRPMAPASHTEAARAS
ncbi:MAG TPA: VOC family protein [Thermomicrobiales bacterium]|nr:VOC family protein [Thermomicrobiales bacterium]